VRTSELCLTRHRLARVGRKPDLPEHYGAHYRDFIAAVYRDVRGEAFGTDIGQNSWATADEVERFGVQLRLRPSARFLDVACGSGGTTLHLARLADCEAVGVELYEEAVAIGRRGAADATLEERVRFVCADASRPLPFESESFEPSSVSTRSTTSPTGWADWVIGLALCGREDECFSPTRWW
jgi:SAM-dependent methyltransferase